MVMHHEFQKSTDKNAVKELFMPPNVDLEAIRREQILNAALRTISERGCANVTMDDICKAAGMSKGGLAHYYKSKDDLFKAVFFEFFQRIFSRSEETMASYEDPMEQLLSFEWLYNAQDIDANLGYPILFDFMSIVVHDEEYRDMFRAWANNWVKLLKKAILLGQSQGRFPGVEVESTAKAISAIYQGVATRWFLVPTEHPTEWAIDSVRRAIKGLLGELTHTND